MSAKLILRTSIQSLLQVLSECKNVHQVHSVMLLVCHVHVRVSHSNYYDEQYTVDWGKSWLG